MNPLQQLMNKISALFPGAELSLTEPLPEDGTWSLEIDTKTSKLDVAWSPRIGFGLSTADAHGAGEGYDETPKSLDLAIRRISQLLLSAEKTLPPSRVWLARLREGRGMTQSELAEKIGVKQATVSGIESRADVQLTTLERVVVGLGGELEIFARFSDGCYRIDRGFMEVKLGAASTASPISQHTRGRNRARVYQYLEKNGGMPRAQRYQQRIKQNKSVLAL